MPWGVARRRSAAPSNGRHGETPIGVATSGPVRSRSQARRERVRDLVEVLVGVDVWNQREALPVEKLGPFERRHRIAVLARRPSPPSPPAPAAARGGRLSTARSTMPRNRAWTAPSTARTPACQGALECVLLDQAGGDRRPGIGRLDEGRELEAARLETDGQVVDDLLDTPGVGIGPAARQCRRSSSASLRLQPRPKVRATLAAHRVRRGLAALAPQVGERPLLLGMQCRGGSRRPLLPTRVVWTEYDSAAQLAVPTRISRGQTSSAASSKIAAARARHHVPAAGRDLRLELSRRPARVAGVGAHLEIRTRRSTATGSRAARGWSCGRRCRRRAARSSRCRCAIGAHQHHHPRRRRPGHRGRP